MRIEIATEPAHPDRPNEDYVAAGPKAVVLLDGAGTPAGSASGCTHGVPWYVARLGTTLLATVTAEPERALTDCLADAITTVSALHADSCDLTHPGTPSATAIVVRLSGHAVEYLVLADSTLVLEPADGTSPIVVTDGREAEVGALLRGPMDAARGGTRKHADAHRAYVEAMRSHRNQPGGFWVAATDPAAAYEALTGSVPRASLAGFTLLSDGAARLVDRFHLTDWVGALRTIHADGPLALIQAVRDAELSDLAGQRWPRGKAHDDTTVATVTL